MSELKYPNLHMDNTGSSGDAPPPYPYTQMGSSPPTAPSAVVTTQPVTTMIISQAPLSHVSQRMVCPTCHSDVLTGVTSETGVMTHLCALALCFVACWPCCLIPYCVDSCKDSYHTCPNCKQHLGVVKRI